MSQNLEESPAKVRQAERIKGSMLFRSAEDEEICARISFFGDHIEIEDHEGEVGSRPAITSDFLSTAHLTTGEEGPFALVVKRKVKVRFKLGQVGFLLRVLRFMQLPKEMRDEEQKSRARRRWLMVAVLAAAIIGAGVFWYIRASA